MSTDRSDLPPLPQSLGTHVIPDDRHELIRAHIKMLGETALEISDSLPFSADVSDFLRVLNDSAERK
ncbi:MAG: hypothetical protein ACR2PA_24770 [Hyphomicrobiaceae bacterium]